MLSINTGQIYDVSSIFRVIVVFLKTCKLDDVDMALKIVGENLLTLPPYWLCPYDFYNAYYPLTIVAVVLLLYICRVKGHTAIFEEMIEDEEVLVDDRMPTTNRGLWAVSETERSMKVLLSFAKSHRFDVALIDEGSTSMDLFEAWKKEYKVQYFKYQYSFQY